MRTEILPLACPQCGGEKFSTPENPRPEDNITCVACGSSATLAEIEETFTRKKAQEFLENYLAARLRKR